MSDKKSAKTAKKTPRRSSALPPLGSMPCIELSGNREAVLEGSKGVLEYSPDTVRVNTVGMIVTFCGRGLDLRCISPSALIIGGTISRIEFTV